MSTNRIETKNLFRLIAVAATLLGIVAAALFFYQKEQIQNTQKRELKVIADYKANEIINWRNNYYRAADEIFYDDKVRQFAENYTGKGKSDEQELAMFREYLAVISSRYSFSGIHICSRGGKEILPSYGTDSKPDDLINAICKEGDSVLAPFISDFHKDENGHIHLTLVVPFFKYSGKQKTPYLFFFGRINPDKELYPVLDSWPYESLTSESTLSMVERDSIVYLNELRHRKNSALSLKISTHDSSYVAVKAFAQADRIVEGLDYRGEKVISYLKRIPDTDWALTVKTDKAELMRPVIYSVFFISGYALLFFGVIIFGFDVFYRKEKKKMYLHLYEEELRRNALLRQYDYILQNSGDIIFLVDESGKITEANQKALKEYGYTLEELAGKPAEIIRGNDEGVSVQEVIALLHKTGEITFETLHKKKDGEVFPVEVSAKLLQIDGAYFYQSIVRDISERKEHEKKIRRLNRLYSMLSASNKAIVRKSNTDDLFSEIIRVAVQIGKFKGVWIGRTAGNQTTETIKEVGFSNGCASLTEILLLKQSEKFNAGFSDGSVFYCNDITGADFLSPEESAKMHIGSFAAMQLSVKQGTPLYVLLISEKKDFFGEDDRYLLDEMAEDLSFGLKFFDMEESFRMTDARLRAVVEESPAGIFILDPAGRMTYSNKLMHQITGVQEDSLENYSWMGILQQKDKRQMLMKWTEAIHEEKSFAAEGSLIRQDGTEIFWRCKTSPIYSGGEIIGHAGVLIDETEIAAKQTEINRLFAAVSQTSSSILITALDGSIEYVNPAFESMTGYKAEEVLGRNPRILQSGLTPRETYTQLFQHLINGDSWRGEFVNRRKCGDIYYETATISPVRNSRGQTVNYLAIKDDITQMREYQKTIENQVRLFINVLELLPVGVWIMDAKGTIVSGNEAAMKIWGGARYVGIDKFAEYKGRWYKTGKEIQPDEWAAARAIRNRETSINEEIEIDCFDGTKKIIYNSAVPIINAQNVLTGAIIVNEDITAIKRTEKELTEAKDRAEEMNRLKSSFLANMSHELRTPMIGVLGYSEIIYDGGFNEEVTEYGKLIHKSGKRLLDTLNLILDMSRLEAGKLDIKKETVDLVKITSEAVENFAGIAERNGLYINFEPEYHYLKIISDERLLNSIVNNLINNAVKYTHTGGVTVRISAIEETEPGKKMIRISVQDTGIGIAPENHEMIFDEFRQVSEGNDRFYEGTGLGLSITRKFVEKLGGAISLESEQGMGSVFHVFIPADVTDELKNEEMHSAQAEDKINNSERRRILLVENDEMNAAIIQKFLHGKYITEHVWDGESAIEKSRERQYKVILMDINLGKGVDGLAAARGIRNSSLNKNTPVIAMTAYAMQHDRSYFLNGGCTHYIAKPFRQIELLQLLDEIFTGAA
ncbi:MAG: PAS domain S-box protein [Ignavibacteriaceae bacterium]|nr:PAS domain S-box protein [Ignavibacteriaceae bacterium]